MKLTHAFAASAAAGLALAPIAASAQGADRATAPVASEDASELGGYSITPLFILIGIAAIGMGALLLTEEDDPVSP